ncbi:MAG: sigma-54 dependent transcriptional regulator [Bacteroidota bacterium]
MNKRPKILIVDDDRAICASISLLLKRKRYEVHTINHPREIEKKILKVKPDLILLDMNFTIDTSGKQGLKALKLIRSIDIKIPIILMTGWATVELAVQGMKNGASDFIAKPWDNKQMLHSVETLLALNGATTTSPEESHSSNSDFEKIVGQDPQFKRVIEMAERVSKTNASVLILGESGTGKEVLAEAIHYNSLRADQAFVKVNLGGISESLFESELFGHKKGAFTDAYADRIGRFTKADGGSIFLDEIGDLALSSQVKLLRVLQEKTFEVLGSSQSQKIDVRVISATNKDLEEMIGEGTFREDLFYRINLIKLELPPLRQRQGDIPLLVHRFITQLKEIYARNELRATESALNWLQRQSFPGNIRQLKNLVERAVLLSPDDLLELKDFQALYQESNKPVAELPTVGSLSLEEMEINMIKKALVFHQNNISLTAKSLGITRSALYRRLQKYNIPYVD